MKCPVCSNELVEYHAGSINVDICRDGCSGIWFDGAEFDKVVEHSEAFPDELLRVRKNAQVVIDRSKIRNCPKCPSQKLQRVVIDPEIRLEIDQCQSCHGTWLDIGELEFIRQRAKEDSEMAARVATFNKKLEAQIQNTDSRYRAQAFLKVIFG